MALAGLFGPTPEKVEKWTAARDVKKLLGALSTDDAVIRDLCATGLAKVGGPDVLKYCQDNATNGDQRVRWSITKILGQMGTPEAMAILETVQDPTAAITSKIINKKINN